MDISDELIALIKLAQGDRSLNKFAKDCDISAGNLSKILRKINPTLPSLTTLHKIASNAKNNVTLIDLMISTGYLPGEIEPERLKTSFVLEEETNKYKEFLLNNKNKLFFDDGTPIDSELLEDFIDTLDITLGILKIKNKKIQDK